MPWSALAPAVLFVLAWRAAGVWLAPEPRGLAIALACMGLLYLGCGLVTLRSVRSRAAVVFALYALCQGLHWGGQLALVHAQWKLAADLLYVVVAVVLAQCLFGLLACEISGRMPWTRDRRAWLLATPVLIAMGVAVAVWIQVADARAALLATYAFADYGLGAVGLIVIAWSARRLDGGLALLAALAIPAAIDLSSGATGLESEWLNLLYGGEALAFAYVIRKQNG